MNKNTIKTALKTKLNEWRNGQIDYDVSNQFDEYIIESALENFNDESFSKVQETFSDAKGISTMDIAYFLSSFDVPELDSAWID